MQQAIEKQGEELVHQRRLGIMPSILIEVDESYICAKNVGNGTALNIKFEHTIENEKLHPEEFSYKTEIILMLCSGESKEIKIYNDSDTKIPIKWTGLRVAGKVVFQDVEGNSYQQMLENLNETGKLRFGFPVLYRKDRKVKL